MVLDAVYSSELLSEIKISDAWAHPQRFWFKLLCGKTQEFFLYLTVQVILKYSQGWGLLMWAYKAKDFITIRLMKWMGEFAQLAS